MCGIVGVWGDGHVGDSAAILESLHHRGPDSHGDWYADDGPWLGHTRLAILDLSDAGAQPMESPSGRYVITFNGEFYRHGDEREQTTRTWAGHSDTETIAAMCDEHGVLEALRRVHGMMAIGVWDKQDRQLTLARDAFGKKPLYWAQWGGRLAFASELKALRTMDEYSSDVDREAVASMLETMAVTGTQAIHRNTAKVAPGTALQFSGPGEAPTCSVLHDLAARSRRAKTEPSVDLAAVESQLLAAVQQRLLSDVPVGSFLSGGIDSSLVTALMADVADEVTTISIGFSESSHDESQHAARIAEHLGTNHIERTLDPEDAIKLIPELPAIYDEPFADSSQLPTLLLCREARRHVTVALSGDGGDEVFGGYVRYRHAAMLNRLRGMPSSLKRPIAGMLRTHVPVERLLPSLKRHRRERLASLLETDSATDLYAGILQNWPEARAAVGLPPRTASSMDGFGADVLDQMMMADTLHYLPDDILVKVDRAAMSVGLEVRCPMLDLNVFDAAWRLPKHMKMHRGTGKIALRQILAKRVPKHLWDRPKQGFGMPVAEWLRGPLNAWADDLLSPESLREFGMVQAEPVQTLWQQHNQGRRDHHASLWNILMLQSWCREYL